MTGAVSETQRGRLLIELVRRCPVGLLVWDHSSAVEPSDMQLLLVNRAAVQLLRLERPLPVGRRLGEVPSVFDSGLAERTLMLGRRGGTGLVGEVSCWRADGSRVEHRAMATALPGARVAVWFGEVAGDRAADAIGAQDGIVELLAASALLVDGVRRHATDEFDREQLETAANTIRWAADEFTRHAILANDAFASRRHDTDGFG